MCLRSLENICRDARLTVRRSGPPDPEGKCVVYWMERAQRAVDNPALNIAVEAANALRKPLVVFLGLAPSGPRANLRQCAFLAEGIHDLARRLNRRGAGLVLRRDGADELAQFCEEVRGALVVGDENPVRELESWRRENAGRLPVPFWTVDADVIVPSKLLEKEQYAARTIRPRIRACLDEFLVSLPNPNVQVAWKPPRGLASLRPDSNLLEGFSFGPGVQPVSDFRGGTDEALRALKRFIAQGLRGYATQRNRPELDGTSRLSPYLHFGHIGPHTVALAVENAAAPHSDREAFLEELIVRRELAVNFVRFNPRYDRLESSERWAMHTLAEHRRDEREYLYTEQQLENAGTHDRLWNAAQKQMALGGWMHGYLRMYWAKKILEWTRSPEEAFNVAVRLNDRYELDGCDPNGYAGIAWAIGGKHDRAWGPERAVYGKIRYMSYQNTSRKFDSERYIKRVEALLRQGEGR